MLRITVVAFLLLFAVGAQGATLALNAPFANVSSITFTQTSSARTATANVRMAAHVGRQARTPTGVELPGTAVNSITDYFLTKSMHISLRDVLSWEVTVDQDTKVYFNAGTDYLKIPSGTRWGTGVYR